MPCLLDAELAPGVHQRLWGGRLMSSAAQVQPRRITLRNLLFPTDFSEPSRLALPWARALAREHGGVLHIAHVVTPLIYPTIAGESLVGTFDTLPFADGLMK